DSFELWLVKLLPADVQLRLPPDGLAALSPAEQAGMARLPGVARVQFRREQPVYLAAGQPPVTLIARELPSGDAAEALPLVQSVKAVPADTRLAWISEALRDAYHL